MITKGKWIRIVCDFHLDYYFINKDYHKCESVFDDIGITFKECFMNAKDAGWIKIKNKWCCPECKNNPKFKK